MMAKISCLILCIYFNKCIDKNIILCYIKPILEITSYKGDENECF